MKVLKLIYYLSAFMTLFMGIAIAYTLWEGLLLSTIMLMPFFIVFYPIALVGTVGYFVKRSLKNMSIMDMMSSFGGSSKESASIFGSQKEQENKEEE